MQQGTFKRRDAQAQQAEHLGVDESALVQPATQKKVKVHAVDGGGLPLVDQTKIVIVYPPPQKFTLDGNTYLIDLDPELTVSGYDKNGYWLVPCVEEADGSGNICFRPETVAEPLPDAMRSPDWGDDYKDMDHRPHPEYARLHVDFSPRYHQTRKIGAVFLKINLERTEKLEYDFALRMQGLLNCGLNAVWTCTEFGFDNADRSHIMEHFLQKYIGRFLTQVTQKQEEMDPDKIVREALQMHSRFSAGWTKEHKKGLSPSLDASSEALVGHFCSGPLKIMVDAGFTRKQIARFLRRNEHMSPQFSLCLHFFMVKMDQDRNGRNANYKSMFNSTNSQLLQMKTLDHFLRSNLNIIQEFMNEHFSMPIELQKFDISVMDWYYIESQLHVPAVQYTGVKRTRTRVARDSPGMFFSQSSSA